MQRNLVKILENPLFTAGINGGYYSGGLHTQQAHSTTPLEAPHSAGSNHPSTGPPQPPSATSAPPAVSAVAPPPGIQHGLVSKSVSYQSLRL
jgi:C-terminal binding protein